MLTIDELLGIIWSEAVEHGGMTEEQWKAEGCPVSYRPEDKNLPAIRYDLELIEREDGTLYWVE